MSAYFKNIRTAFGTMTDGIRLTMRYLSEAVTSRDPMGIADPDYFKADKGIVTLQYPSESFPVPEIGRYRLHNEIDDCIVCDKCAKVCPVDCIEIDAIRAPESFGVTSDGTPKRIHAARFDIDMSKCCFCGLCTTVCPTECLTMTKVYDFSEFEVEDHTYSFAEMSLVEIAQKRKELEEYERQKAKAAAAASTTEKESIAGKPKIGNKPSMKPKPAGAKPVMKPKPSIKTEAKKEEEEKKNELPRPRPKFKPKPMIKRKPKSDGDE